MNIAIEAQDKRSVDRFTVFPELVQVLFEALNPFILLTWLNQIVSLGAPIAGPKKGKLPDFATPAETSTRNPLRPCKIFLRSLTASIQTSRRWYREGSTASLVGITSAALLGSHSPHR